MIGEETWKSVLVYYYLFVTVLLSFITLSFGDVHIKLNFDSLGVFFILIVSSIAAYSEQNN